MLSYDLQYGTYDYTLQKNKKKLLLPQNTYSKSPYTFQQVPAYAFYTSARIQKGKKRL